MPEEKALTIDYSQKDAASTFAPKPLLSSQQAGWRNIHLAHYQLPAIEVPEIYNVQHVIVIPFWKQPVEVELIAEGKRYLTQHDQKETALNCIEVLPAYVPISSKCKQEIELMHCYLEPTFLAHAAHESVNPDRVEVKLALQAPDPLVCQIGLALRSVLETDANNSYFYAESMATALAAHFLKYYSTRKHFLQEYEDGLPKYKLKQAFEYVAAHLHQDVSLVEISEELGISQYYFCRLFKKSTGMSPHAYLIQQRVERSKQLLKQRGRTINEIAVECGFANPSHFAKCFRRYTGISPNQFRMM
ncbi:AraC family transcriptional regulator [Nostoc sp.]|uniref:AraC family transcriptional regulator n=1 Tax=Nostoc sp. TaxID=1180 RepID=UPI002FFBCAB1